MKIDQLISKIEEANTAYREGNPIMEDHEWDSLMDQLKQVDPTHPLLSQVGHIVNDERKQVLPHPMASMNKIKTFDEFVDWRSSKGIPAETYMVLTPKYDGVALLRNEAKPNEAWTRGDGKVGQFIPEHFSKVEMGYASGVIHQAMNIYSVGELIMSRKNFESKYEAEYKNARNLVAGAVNRIDPDGVLSDCDFMRFGVYSSKPMDKKDQLDLLNKINPVKIPYVIVRAMYITEQTFYDLFTEWNAEYEIDGIIVEVNNAELREQLGRETSSNNPCYARAFKGNFEDVAETTCTDVTWQVSKQGVLNPVVHIEPVKLNGAVVSKLYGDNARWMAIYDIGVGSKFKVKRSGMVIPRIINVDGFDVIPKNYKKACDAYDRHGTIKSVGGMLDFIREELGIKGIKRDNPHFQYPEAFDKWNDSYVEILAKGMDDEIQQQKMVAFFEHMDIENVSDSTVVELWNRGYKTIKDILELHPTDMMLWDGWGDRKAQIIHESIHSKLKNVPVEKIQHASGLFYGLGSKKLALVKHFDAKPTFEQLVAVEGFSDKSAQVYLDGIDEFWNWVKDLPITIKLKDDKIEVTGNKCDGWAVVFTGFRDKNLENLIVENGGEIKSSVSNKATHLIMKEKGSGSSKEKKALDLGLQVFSKEELEGYLNPKDGEDSLW